MTFKVLSENFTFRSRLAFEIPVKSLFPISSTQKAQNMLPFESGFCLNSSSNGAIMLIVTPRIMAWLFSVLSLAFSLPTHAGVEMSVNCKSGGTTLYGTTLCNNPSIYSHSTATAYGQYGVIKAGASATAWAGAGSSAAGVHVRYYDTFTINSAGLTGQANSASSTPVFSINSSMATGSGLYSESSKASIVSMAVNNGNSTRTHILKNYVDGNGPGMYEHSYAQNNGLQTSLNTPMLLNWDFVYGAPISIFVDLQISASALYDGTAIIDAMHSLYWGGIEVAGLTHDQFFVSSVSGTDWEISYVPDTQELPEPSTFYLGLAMLVLLLLLRKSSKPEFMIAFLKVT